MAFPNAAKVGAQFVSQCLTTLPRVLPIDAYIRRTSQWAKVRMAGILSEGESTPPPNSNEEIVRTTIGQRDRMNIEDLVRDIQDTAGPPISHTDITRFEQQAGVTIPPQYAEFLTRCNGGRPDARFSAADIAPDTLFGIREEPGMGLGEAIERLRRQCPAPLCDELFPIADRHNGSLVCIRTRGEERGTLWSLNQVHSDAAFPSERASLLTPIASSFTAFVHALEPTPINAALEMYEQGRERFESGIYADALARFEASWAITEHGSTAFWIAQCLRHLARDDAVTHWLTLAADRSPSNDKYCTAYAADLAQRGHTTEAKRMVGTILQRNPTYGPAKRLAHQIEQNNGESQTP